MTGIDRFLFDVRIIPALIVLLAAFHFLTLFLAPTVYGGDTSQSSVTVPSVSSTPVVSAVKLNSNSSSSGIILTANATTAVTVSFTVSDNDGCGDVFINGNVTTTVYRSGVGSSSAPSTLSLYQVSTSTSHTCTVATTTSADATSTFEIYFFADATDASSSFTDQYWEAFVRVRDATSSTHSASSTGVEMNTLLAIDVSPSSTSYGTLAAGTDTSSTNQTETVKNAGNSSSSLQLSGTALTSGANSIATTSQHYATSTFTFGGAEQALQVAATAVSGFLIPRPPLTVWSSTVALPVANRSHAALAYNGYLYTIGGTASTGVTTTVLFAPINSTGLIGNWSTTAALPSSTYNHTAVVYNGYLYKAGGLNAANIATATVLFAPVNSTGSIGNWSTTTALPSSTIALAMAVNNGYLYVTGGSNAAGIATATVLFAPVNSTGSIGNWSTTTALPSSTSEHSASVYNNYLYSIGGNDSASIATATVLFAPVNSTGSIGNWSTTTALPSAIAYHSTVLNDSYFYTTAGNLAGNPTSTVFFAPINASGSMGNWSTLTALPSTLYEHSAAVYNGYLYTIGGLVNAVTRTSTVFYTSLFSRDTYWGLTVPGGTASGTYTGTVTYTAVFNP